MAVKTMQLYLEFIVLSYKCYSHTDRDLGEAHRIYEENWELK